MSADLHMARLIVQYRLKALGHTHLMARIANNSLIIYSVEHSEEVCRAILTPCARNEYLLSIANHRGNWQPTPFIGTLSEVMLILTDKLAFALARWP